MRDKEVDAIFADGEVDQLPSDKIKINWNKNPILMEEFRPFLNVALEK